MADLLARARKLAALGAADPQTPETDSAARQLARLIHEHQELFEPQEKEEEDDDDPFDATIGLAISELEKLVNGGGGSVARNAQRKARPQPPSPFAGAIFMGWDAYGRAVWKR